MLDRTPLIELIKMTLNHGVYTVQTASTADEVAGLLEDIQPHLVLLDVDLDGMETMALVGARAVGVHACQ